MKKSILVIPGDGIGTEVTVVSKRLLQKIGKKYNYTFEMEEALMGHIAIEATGEPLPEETLSKAKKADAILFGAIGHPHYDENPNLPVRPEQGLLKLRKDLGLFANLRPIQLFKELIPASSLKSSVIEGTDILFFRELTGGIYFGKPRERREQGEVAIDTMVYSRTEVRRIAKMAFEAAMNRTKRVCSVDKANVLESSRLWREMVGEVAKDYPEVEVTNMFIDNAAMQLIKNPRFFDVVLTGNMFGDILTDAASQISGSLGMLPSASVGQKVGLYEPIHGSAPDIAGKNLANPLASVLSLALMLEIAFEMKKEGDELRAVIDKVLQEGWRTQDIADANTPKEKILGTQEIGEKLIEYLDS